MDGAMVNAWARKYRPYKIDDYLGNDIKNVVHARFRDKTALPHVLMLYGTRGCGKTTFARIIAKYYLCINPIDGEPCEQCEMCNTINEVLIPGNFGVECPGVYEVDATTANTKEEIQRIVEDAVQPPMFGEYKIIIFDECHMITPQAQNSLLKILEDIPSHLVCIFCTTDPDRVLQTIHSRCQLKLEVRKKSVEELANRLLYIAQQEGLKTSPEALKLIAKKADRIPRDAINLLERVAKSNGNTVNIEAVLRETAAVADELYVEYIESANKSLEDILLFNQKLKEKDVSAKRFISGLTRFVLDAMYIRHGINIEDYSKEYIDAVNKLFKHYKSSEFDTLLQVIEYAYKMMGDDDIKNELIITTTAMRIGKIGLLASGLQGEAARAEAENKMSMQEYRKKVEEEIESQMTKTQTFSPTREKLASLLKGISDVKSVGNIEIKRQYEDDENTENGFVSTNELRSLLED